MTENRVKCENCNHCKYIGGSGYVECRKLNFLHSRPQYCKHYQDDDTIKLELFGKAYMKLLKKRLKNDE